jgi:hypothetical protein
MANVRVPNRSSNEPRFAAPALSSRVKCPNCGRAPASVFPLMLDRHTSEKDAPLVCVACCLGYRARS